MVFLLYDNAKISSAFNFGKLGDRYVLVTSYHDLAGKTMSQYLIRSAGFESPSTANSYGESYLSAHHRNIQLYVFYGNLLTLENISKLYSRSEERRVGKECR